MPVAFLVLAWPTQPIPDESASDTQRKQGGSFHWIKTNRTYDIPSSSSPARKTVAFVVFLITLLVGNVYLYSKIKRSEVDAYTLQQKLEDKLAKLEKNSSTFRGPWATHNLEMQQLQFTISTKLAPKSSQKGE